MMALQIDSVSAEARARRGWLRESAQDEDIAPGSPRRISIFGLGYVGAVSLACLARDGHEMFGVDIDPGKLELLRRGQAPIVETGIQELTRAVMRGGTVSVTDSVRDAILATDISFVCVGTPARQNGNQDLAAITRIAEQIGAILPEKATRHIVVIRSTVKPGTLDEVIKPAIEAASGLQAGRDFSLCFQPEFLREGTSINDYDNPPLTVVGADDPHAVEALRGLFGHLPCEFMHTSVRTAEMLK
jgi:GDP-mannose 6-dehydrogenase